MKDLGKIRPDFRGVWNASATYAPPDMVCDAQRTTVYWAKSSVPAGTPLTNTTYWAPMLSANAIMDRIGDMIDERLEALDNGTY